jgi:hypothetical protein
MAMTDEQVLQLLRVFISQVERTLDASARLFDTAVTGSLPESEAKRAATTLRELAAQARMIRPMLPPPVM